MNRSLPPVVDDLGVYLVPGREKDPTRAFAQAADAERLGFKRAWFSERWDTKEAGAVAGALAARTTRLEIATGMVAAGSRHPLMAAALGATVQAISGGRFVLGLGRSDRNLMRAQSMRVMSYQAYADYVGIVRRLWRGETVSYDGPAGRYESIRMADHPDCAPPPIWTGIYAGPRASTVAAAISDGIVIMDFFTPDATRRAVTNIRQERERLGLGPIPICVCVIAAPELDQLYTTNLTSARFVTYIVGLPETARAYATYNGWDGDVMRDICAHPMFSRMKSSIGDQSLHRGDLYDVAGMVPKSWMHEACAIGSVAECVEKLKEFRAAGADEIVLHGSSPADNAQLIAAWRQRADAAPG